MQAAVSHCDKPRPPGSTEKSWKGGSLNKFCVLKLLENDGLS